MRSEESTARPRRGGVKLSPQAMVLVLSLSLCAVWPTPKLWTWLAAYGVAWLALNYTLASARTLKLAVPVWAVLGLAALLAAPAVSYLWRERETVARREGLRGLDVRLPDRLRLEAVPAVFPPLVAGDRPQSLYVHAPAAGRVRLELAAGVEPLPGVDLGNGLFRVAYDPRRHGVPTDDRSRLAAAVVVDGAATTRALRYVRWQPHPRQPCSDPELGLAAVPSEETDEVFVVTRRQEGDGALTARVPVADGPTACAFAAAGRVAVAHRYDRRLQVLDPRRGEIVAGVELGPFQVAVAASSDGRTLAVARAGARPEIVLVSVGSDQSLAVAERIPLDSRLDGHFEDGLEPAWVGFAGAGTDRLVMASDRHRALFRLDRDAAAESGWRQTELYLGRPAVAAALSSDRRQLYVAATDFRPDAEQHRGNHFVQDQILRVDLDGWRVVGQRLTGRRSPRQDFPGDTDRGVSPMGLTALGNGDLLVAFAGSDEVWRLDGALARSPRVYSGTELDLIAPHGVADLGAGVWLATSPAGGCTATYSADGEMIEFLSLSPTDDELAAAGEGSLARQDLALRAGERAFYETTRSGISCQSCHLRGSTDFSPHDIGQSPLLQTLTTRGLAGTAPYLRDGSFPRVRDLHFDLAEPLYRGYRRFAADRPQLLEDYVHALAAATNPALFEDRDLALERAGMRAFVRARCELCHAPPAFTNLASHLSRTLFPAREVSETALLDTPSLLAVHAKEEFLQDGRAEDLAAVLGEHNRANRHGDTAILDDEEKRALVHLLRSL